MAKTKVHGEYLKDSVVRFTAKAGENITKGQAVYISGISGEVSVVSLADANDTAKMPAFGLAEATVSTNAEVEITSFGTLKGLDTSSYSLGDILYVDTTAGSLTNNPSGLEATKLQNIGIVQRVHATSGSIKVGGAGRTNAVPNLDDGDIFIGDSNNKAVSDSFTNVLNTEAGINSSADATAITIDSSENVGIGGSPTNYSDHKTLSLYGNTGTGAGFIEFNDTSGNADAVIFSDNGNLFINADYDNTTADSSIRFRVDGSSEKMRIDASGAVGIGQVPETARFSGHDILQVGGRATLLGNDTVSATGQTVLLDNLYYDASGTFQHRGNSRGVVMQFVEGQVIFSNSNQTAGTPTVSERMRITSSGGLEVGDGTNYGYLKVINDDAIVGYFDRRNGSGTILQFRKDDLPVGNISVVSQDRMVFATADGLGLQFDKDNNRIVPCDADGAYNNNVELGDENLAFTNLFLTGGIQFDSRSNKLDDYEEGTFTPTVNSGGSSTSWAKYTKIGDTVFITCEIILSGTRSTGYFIVSGLPFTNGNAWTPCSFYAQYYNNEGTQQASGVFRANTNDFYVHDFGNEAAGTDFGNGYFNFAGTYKIN